MSSEKMKRVAYEGSFLRVDVDPVELPTGKSIELEVVRHPGASAIVPLLASGEVVLLRQFRHAASGWLVEVPAGKLDPGEEPSVAAARELEEETGLRANRWDPLGFIYTSPGFTDERIWLFLARDLETATQSLEDDEVLTLERVPLATAVERARNGEIEDGKSVCALLRAAALLDTENGF